MLRFASSAKDQSAELVPINQTIGFSISEGPLWRSAQFPAALPRTAPLRP